MARFVGVLDGIGKLDRRQGGEKVVELGEGEAVVVFAEGPQDLLEPEPIRWQGAGQDEAGEVLAGRLGGWEPLSTLDFDREAETLANAVFEATEAIEAAVPGVRVVHLEPDDLVTMPDIAERTGRTRESVRLLINGKRGPGGFPPPATHLKSRNRMWEWQEVAGWFAQALDEAPEASVVAAPTDSGFIVAFNAGLRLRRADGMLRETDRRRIRRLVG